MYLYLISGIQSVLADARGLNPLDADPKMICRLTTARSGEIIARLGSGNFNQARNLPRPSTAGESKLAPVQELSRRASMTNIAINGPKEPEDGTRAQPGPSSAKNVGQSPLSFSLPIFVVILTSYLCCHSYILFLSSFRLPVLLT